MNHALRLYGRITAGASFQSLRKLLGSPINETFNQPWPGRQRLRQAGNGIKHGLRRIKLSEILPVRTDLRPLSGAVPGSQDPMDLHGQAFDQAEYFLIREFSGGRVQGRQQGGRINPGTCGMELSEHVPPAQRVRLKRVLLPGIGEPCGQSKPVRRIEKFRLLLREFVRNLFESGIEFIAVKRFFPLKNIGPQVRKRTFQLGPVRPLANDGFTESRGLGQLCNRTVFCLNFSVAHSMTQLHKFPEGRHGRLQHGIRVGPVRARRQ